MTTGQLLHPSGELHPRLKVLSQHQVVANRNEAMRLYLFVGIDIEIQYRTVKI